jgi:DNA-binding NtrC family response regulator
MRKTLLVMSPYEKDEFLKIIEELDLDPLFAPSAVQAERLLARNPEIEVVVVDQELLDGTWQDVAEVIASRESPASLLICTKHVGDIDILAASRRVHIPDVLIRPYDPVLVRQRIEHALRCEQRKPLDGASVPSHPATVE